MAASDAPRAININVLRLALGLHKRLVAEIPALVDEVNALDDPDLPELHATPIEMPKSIELGITNRLIRKEFEELPALACGVYDREGLSEGEELFAEVAYPYSVEVYMADKDSTLSYIKAMKWQAVLDAFVQRHLSADRLYDFSCEASATMNITYALEIASDEIYKQVIAAMGVFTAVE